MPKYHTHLISTCKMYKLWTRIKMVSDKYSFSEQEQFLISAEKADFLFYFLGSNCSGVCNIL